VYYLGYGLSNNKIWVPFLAEVRIFLFFQKSQTVTEVTDIPGPWLRLPGTLSPSVNQPENEITNKLNQKSKIKMIGTPTLFLPLFVMIYTMNH